MPCDQSSGTIPVVNTILNSLVKAADMNDFECLKNSFRIWYDEHTLFNFSLWIHFETSSSVISQFSILL